MDRKVELISNCIYIPVAVGRAEVRAEIFLEDEVRTKLFEFLVPVDAGAKKGAYRFDYMAKLPAGEWQGKTVIICGEGLTEAFLDSVNTDGENVCLPEEERPTVHFTPQYGWMNDPNGLVFADGIYHMYFQHNLFNTKWNNMTWGHAVSRDLLHWEEKETVLFGDEYGTVFSGSAIKSGENEITCFYTAAPGNFIWSEGRLFTQRMARSTDSGMTFRRCPGVMIDTVAPENRDPKVFWHEESKAYICVLWLEENDFGIFRSEDLKEWELTDRLTLDGAWECPDLVQLKIYNEEGSDTGRTVWMFTAADGYCFWGEFDGRHFKTDGVRHEAYSNKIPYAAQTYSNISGRTVLVPWLKLPNDGRIFTGCMGIPMELSAVLRGGELKLKLWPVREFWDICTWIDTAKLAQADRAPGRVYVSELELDRNELMLWFAIGGEQAVYDRSSGILTVGEYEFSVGADCTDMTFILDDTVLEVFADKGLSYGAASLKRS